MEDKKSVKFEKDKVYLYLISVSIVVNFIILWFLQVEIFLWVCLGISIFGIIGAILKISRKTYMNTILSIKVLSLIGTLIILKKAFKYILIPGNVLNLLGEIPFGDVIYNIANFASIVLIILLLAVLWIITSLVLMSYNIVYLVKLHKEKEVKTWKCLLRFLGYGIPLLSWIILLIDMHDLQKGIEGN